MSPSVPGCLRCHPFTGLTKPWSSFGDVSSIKVSRSENGNSCVRQVLYSPELGKKSICSLIVLVPYLSFLQELVFSLGNSVRSSYERMCVCVCVCAHAHAHACVCACVHLCVCVYGASDYCRISPAFTASLCACVAMLSASTHLEV